MIMYINLMSFLHHPCSSKTLTKLICTIIGILFLLVPLHSQSFKEKEDFSFIVEMFYNSDGYLDEAAKEIAVSKQPILILLIFCIWIILVLI